MLRLTRGTGPQAAWSTAGTARPAGRGALQAVQQLQVLGLVGGGLGLAHGGLAQHVQGEADAALVQRLEGRDRAARVPAHDEALREAAHLAAYDGAGHGRHGRALRRQVHAPAQHRGRGHVLLGEVLAQVAADLAAAAQRGEHVDEAQQLDLELLVGHGPLHHLALPALRRQARGVLGAQLGEQLARRLLDAALCGCVGGGSHATLPMKPSDSIVPGNGPEGTGRMCRRAAPRRTRAQRPRGVPGWRVPRAPGRDRLAGGILGRERP